MKQVIVKKYFLFFSVFILLTFLIGLTLPQKEYSGWDRNTFNSTNTLYKDKIEQFSVQIMFFHLMASTAIFIPENIFKSFDFFDFDRKIVVDYIDSRDLFEVSLGLSNFKMFGLYKFFRYLGSGIVLFFAIYGVYFSTSNLKIDEIKIKHKVELKIQMFFSYFLITTFILCCLHLMGNSYQSDSFKNFLTMVVLISYPLSFLYTIRSSSQSN